jgi:hypothetical protein
VDIGNLGIDLSRSGLNLQGCGSDPHQHLLLQNGKFSSARPSGESRELFDACEQRQNSDGMRRLFSRQRQIFVHGHHGILSEGIGCEAEDRGQSPAGIA